MRVLLVEDDGMIAQGLQTALRQGNYAVDWVADGKSADAALKDSVFDLVLLDLGLPQRDGLDVLRAMRQRGGATPVIILTARDEVGQRIAGLDAGDNARALAGLRSCRQKMRPICSAQATSSS